MNVFWDNYFSYCFMVLYLPSIILSPIITYKIVKFLTNKKTFLGILYLLFVLLLDIGAIALWSTNFSEHIWGAYFTFLFSAALLGAIFGGFSKNIKTSLEIEEKEPKKKKVSVPMRILIGFLIAILFFSSIFVFCLVSWYARTVPYEEIETAYIEDHPGENITLVTPINEQDLEKTLNPSHTVLRLRTNSTKEDIFSILDFNCELVFNAKRYTRYAFPYSPDYYVEPISIPQAIHKNAGWNSPVAFYTYSNNKRKIASIEYSYQDEIGTYTNKIAIPTEEAFLVYLMMSERAKMLPANTLTVRCFDKDNQLIHEEKYFYSEYYAILEEY